MEVHEPLGLGLGLYRGIEKSMILPDFGLSFGQNFRNPYSLPKYPIFLIIQKYMFDHPNTDISLRVGIRVIFENYHYIR